MALKFVRSTICTNLGEAKTGFCEVARHAWREGEKKRPSGRDFIATARYKSTNNPNPPYEVTVATRNGTLIWAGSNLNGYQDFCTNDSDLGCLFQWGYKTALIGNTGYADYSAYPGIWPTTSVNTATTWPDSENPCPSPWRLPTRDELADLVGYTGTGEGVGVANGTYTTNTWTPGSDFTVKPKSGYGNTSESIYFPVGAGIRTDVGAVSWKAHIAIWTSTTRPDQTSTAYNLHAGVNQPTGYVWSFNKLFAVSVRCVRTP